MIIDATLLTFIGFVVTIGSIVWSVASMKNTLDKRLTIVETKLEIIREQNTGRNQV